MNEPPRALRGTNSGALTPWRKLGEGGEGTVWTIRERDDVVAKIYHGGRMPPRTKAKVLAMIQTPPEQMQNRSYRIAWPTETVNFKGGRTTAGYLMPLLDPAAMPEIGAYFNQARRKRRARERGRPYHAIHLLALARNLAELVAAIHEAGHLIGDLSSRNVRGSDRGRIGLIDTDSMEIREPGSEARHRCDVGTPEYCAPELQGVELGTAARTENTDRFALAVMIYQLLFQGRHPFAGIRPKRSEDAQVMGAAEMIREGRLIHLRTDNEYRPAPQDRLIWTAMPFKRQFKAGLATQGERYPASRWVADIEQAGERMKRCADRATHQYFGSRQCTWCRYRASTGTEPFPE